MNMTDDPNCSYRYSDGDTITKIAMWIDGPITFLAAFMALFSARYAVRFLCKAGLNKHLTAALFALCVVDSMLMVTVFCFYSIEALCVLVLGREVLHTEYMVAFQHFSTSLHGVASSMTTASTLLVTYITFLRFMVVVRPLRYVGNHSHRGRRTTRTISNTEESTSKTRKSSSLHESELMNSISVFRSVSRTKDVSIRKLLQSYTQPGLIILMAFILNIPTFFEFSMSPCYDVVYQVQWWCPYPTPFREWFTKWKTVLNSLTQTTGPVFLILTMTVITEFKVHRSLKDRRKLFESQQRARSIVISEELKERVSRAVAIFIAVKFLILRSMPLFFDVYELMHGVQAFGLALSVLVRVADFMVVLNSATNSFTYFGKKRWLEKRLRLRLLKKEEKRQQKLSSTRMSQTHEGVASGARAPIRMSTCSEKEMTKSLLTANGTPQEL